MAIAGTLLRVACRCRCQQLHAAAVGCAIAAAAASQLLEPVAQPRQRSIWIAVLQRLRSWEAGAPRVGCTG